MKSTKRRIGDLLGTPRGPLQATVRQVQHRLRSAQAAQDFESKYGWLLRQSCAPIDPESGAKGNPTPPDAADRDFGILPQERRA